MLTISSKIEVVSRPGEIESTDFENDRKIKNVSVFGVYFSSNDSG